MPLKAQFDKAVFYIRNGSESNSDNKKKFPIYIAKANSSVSHAKEIIN